MVQERFIERGTDFPLEMGKLSIYETNCVCKDIRFYFDSYVLTLMLSGHKTITSEHLKFEFFPGTFFIPERGTVNHVSIPNASPYNPTKCLVLELKPDFIRSVYEEIAFSGSHTNFLYPTLADTPSPYFLSNDQLLIQTFTRLYDLQFQDRSPAKPMVEELIVRELLVRLFPTEGLRLLKRNFESSVEDEQMRKVIAHIRGNLTQKLTTASLLSVAGMGQTTFFKAFKEATGYSPTDFVKRERINQAKMYMQIGRLGLQEIAYKCGFNSYEYFCSSFRKIEGKKPTEFQKGARAFIKN